MISRNNYKFLMKTRKILSLADMDPDTRKRSDYLVAQGLAEVVANRGLQTGTMEAGVCLTPKGEDAVTEYRREQRALRIAQIAAIGSAVLAAGSLAVQVMGLFYGNQYPGRIP